MKILLQAIGLVLLATPAAAQRGDEGAEGFVRGVYASYSEDEGAQPLMDRRLELVWSERTAALIRRDQELNEGDLPYLDADPICNCQDWENLRVLSVGLSNRHGPGWVATVRFVNAGEETTTLLMLSGSPLVGWRIDDVLNQDGYPSLAESLAESNRRIEAGGRPLYRE